MTNFDLGNNSRKDLIFSKQRIEKEGSLEDGSQDLYDIIKFCPDNYLWFYLYYVDLMGSVYLIFTKFSVILVFPSVF